MSEMPAPTPIPPTYRVRELLVPPLVVRATELPLYFIRLNPEARAVFWHHQHARDVWLRYEAEVTGPARLGGHDCLEIRVACCDLAGRGLKEQLIYAARTERGVLWYLHVARRPGQPPTITGDALRGHVTPRFPATLRTDVVEDLSTGRWVARRAVQLVVGDDRIDCAEALRLRRHTGGRRLDLVYLRPDGSQVLAQRALDVDALAWESIAPRPETEAAPAHLQQITADSEPFWIVESNWAGHLVSLARNETDQGE